MEITGLEGSTPAMERHKGLTDVLKEEPGIEITASVDGAWLQSVAGEKMDSVFQTNKEIIRNLVFAQNDRMAIGAYLSAVSNSWKRKCCLSALMRCPVRNMEWNRS